jgi:hypothetical protein
MPEEEATRRAEEQRLAGFSKGPQDEESDGFRWNWERYHINKTRQPKLPRCD